MNAVRGLLRCVPSAFLAGLAFTIVSPPRLSAADWWNPVWRFRLPVSVSASGYQRTGMPAEVQVNFTQALADAGGSGAFIQNSLRVVEVDQTGAVIDTAVAFQFDPAPGYEPQTNAAGSLVILLKGTTGPSGERLYHIYFDAGNGVFQPFPVTDQVVLTDGIIDEGQESFRLETPEGTLFYHKQGAGFSSWFDVDGNDWISYGPAPGSGSSGEFRGIPNAVYPEGHFHPGKTSATTVLEGDGPLKATFRSTTTDGQWECVWEVFPRFARMTMTRSAHTYWFLYEGTPGGLMEPATDFMVRSGGTQTLLSESWKEDLAGTEWVYFSDPGVGSSGRSLFAVAHETDNDPDSFFPLNTTQDSTGVMTVFGFGRDYPATVAYLNTVPRRFTVGLVDGTGQAAVIQSVDASFRPLGITTGTAEQFLLAAPSPVSPGDGAAGVALPAVFRWTRVASASRYRVQVAADPSFAAPAFDSSALTDTVVSIPGLRAGTSYVWRVRGVSGAVEGPFSAVRSLTTRLDAPSLVSPDDGASQLTLPVSFFWRSIPGVQHYRLQIARDPGFQTPEIDIPEIPDTTRLVRVLENGVTYYWRVNAGTPDTASVYSPARYFVTIPRAPGPALISPEDQATGVPLTETFRWLSVPRAQIYQFQLGTDPLLHGPLVKNDSSIMDTFRTVVGLAQLTDHYWRVRARTDSGYTAFSGLRTFRTLEPLPAKVEQVLPAEGSQVTSDTARLIWMRSGPNVLTYQVEVAIDSLFEFSITDSTGSDTSYTVRPLLPGRMYWWKVRARNSQGWGAFSDTRRFSVVLTSVTPEPDVPGSYVLEQNYPNPFNPATTIRFGVPAQGHVRLDVFSLLGERVATLVDATLAPGTYTVVFPGEGHASGVYLCRLTAPGTIQIRKMVLAR